MRIVTLILAFSSIACLAGIKINSKEEFEKSPIYKQFKFNVKTVDYKDKLCRTFNYIHGARGDDSNDVTFTFSVEFDFIADKDLRKLSGLEVTIIHDGKIRLNEDSKTRLGIFNNYLQLIDTDPAEREVLVEEFGKCESPVNFAARVPLKDGTVVYYTNQVEDKDGGFITSINAYTPGHL